MSCCNCNCVKFLTSLRESCPVAVLLLKEPGVYNGPEAEFEHLEAQQRSDSITKLFRVFLNGLSHNYCVICCKMAYHTAVAV